MSLNDLHLQHSYRTGRDDMVKGFFVPCLEQAVLYRRAAGYFTSLGLVLTAGDHGVCRTIDPSWARLET